jgi:hypothetical protein
MPKNTSNQDNKRHALPRQLVPNFYTIRVNDTIVAQVVAIQGTDVFVTVRLDGVATEVRLGSAYHNQECWYINPSAKNLIKEPASLHITSEALGDRQTLDEDVSGDARGNPLFTSSQAGTWVQVIDPLADHSVFQLDAAPAQPDDAKGVYLEIVASDNAPYLTGVQWYLTGLLSAPWTTGGVLDPSSDTSYAPTRALPTSYYALASKRP